MWVVSVLGCQGEPTAADTKIPVDPPVLVVPEPAPPASDPDAPPPHVTATNCADLSEGGPVTGCFTGTVSCGDTVAGHTKGGSQSFDTRFYEAKYCTPATSNHDSGDERVYALTMPEGDHRALVYLDSPCADLDLAAIRVPTLAACPTVATEVPACEMWPKPGNDREKVEIVSRGASTWLLVVEGKDDEEGAFGLTVRCVDGL